MLLLIVAMQVTAVGTERPLSPINPGSWIAARDYPADALLLHQEGDVGFRVDVDASGAVTDCEIAAPSGIKSLDDRTCTLLKERARFDPGVGPNGNAMASHYSSTIRWHLPPLLNQNLLPMTISIESGAFHCTVDSQHTQAAWSDQGCQAAGAALIREGQNLPVTLMEPFGGGGNWIINDDYPADALRNSWGGRSTFLLDLDASGKVTKCAITASAGHKSLDEAACRNMMTRAHFAAAKGADGQGITSHFAGSIDWQIPDR